MMEVSPRRAIRKLNLIGIAILAIMVGGIGGWAATTELAGAVVAPGSVVVESNIKKVQHSTGGIVSEILVREGSRVEEGQVLVRLDDTLTKATLGIVRSQLDELLTREARLLAERDGGDSIVFPETLLQRQDRASVASAIRGEKSLFDARRMSRHGQRAQLRERIAQAEEEVRGLSAQQAAKEKEIEYVTEEFAGVSELYKRNLIPIIRYMQLKRDQARLSGESGQLIADIARSRGKISETELQIIQVDQDFRTEILRELREAQGKVAEVSERAAAAEDQLKRIDLRAPQSGTVLQLGVHTVGGVISNGEIIMQIVPKADRLVVESKVAPQDVDQIAEGAMVNVRIMAGNQRTTPEVTGEVTRISADLTKEQQTNQAYYVVRVTLDQAQVQALANRDLVLVPGMPAEAFITTYDRTPLQYLLKPLRDQIARTFRER